MEKHKNNVIKTSFNLLTTGLNIRQSKSNDTLTKSINNQDNTAHSTEEPQKHEIFPNCSKEKHAILSVKTQISNIKTSTTIPDNKKDKQIHELNTKLKDLTQILYNKLNLISSSEDDTDPQVSFQEIQTQCKLRKIFTKIMTDNYKFSIPSPIQSTVIPWLINNKNVIGSSETGSGKTLSYLIPCIHTSLLNKLKNKSNKVLIILPTKELAKQIYNETWIFSNYYTENEIKAKYINKGMIHSITSNPENFINNNDIFIATPSNIHNLLLTCGDYLINKLTFIVLDEADKFFDLGFIDIIDNILVKVKDKPYITKAFFSATILDSIGEVITSHIFDSVKISIGLSNIPSKSVEQEFVYCTNEEGKWIGMKNILKQKLEFPMLIFVEGIGKWKAIYEALRYEIQNISYIHSHMTKIEREEQVNDFRVGKTWIWITSDLLARGVDFKNVKTVVNYDCPYKAVNYIHRIGRTGRAGKKGKAFTFVVDDDVSKLKGISRMVNNIIKSDQNSNIKCPNWWIKLCLPNNKSSNYNSKNNKQGDMGY